MSFKRIRQCIWMLLPLILFLMTFMQISCKSNANYVYEEMQLIDQENSNKVADLYSFTPEQVEIIKELQPYIPERAEITFVDGKGFVYFDLGKSSFAVKVNSSQTYGIHTIAIYPMETSKKKRR